MNNRYTGQLAIAIGAAITLSIAAIYLAWNQESPAETESPITRIESPLYTPETETHIETEPETEPETERVEPESETQPETTIETVPSIEASTPRSLTYREDIPLEAVVQDYIVTMCAERGIDPAVIFAMIAHESTYRADVIGDRGNSYGLMQIQPRWHQARMDKLGVTDLLDPIQNVTVGIDYLDELIDDYYGGDLTKALVAYNQGHYRGTVTAYAKTVLNEAERIRSYGT